METVACEVRLEKVVLVGGGGVCAPHPASSLLEGEDGGGVVNVGMSGWRVSVNGLDERNVVYSANVGFFHPQRGGGGG